MGLNKRILSELDSEYYLGEAQRWYADANRVMGRRNTQECLRFAEVAVQLALAKHNLTQALNK